MKKILVYFFLLLQLDYSKLFAASQMRTCGTVGDIETRISDCRLVNGKNSFYNGINYREKSGDWRLVSVVYENNIKYEVWRDEQTSLIWSDKTRSNYNWYRAAGYARPENESVEATGFSSEPNTLVKPPYDLSRSGWSADQAMMQPSRPVSVCTDVVDGKLVAGDSDDRGYIYVNPESAFKARLGVNENVNWKLPSIDDYKLADTNGMRKVLPNMDYTFWSSSSNFGSGYAWIFIGDRWYLDGKFRLYSLSVRCVGFVQN